MIKFVGILTGTTILLPFFINWLFGYIIPLLPGTMFVGTNETWVIFIGGFLGASLTLVGVYWQLEKTKEHQNKELISNTEAVYQLLKNELDIILTKLIAGTTTFKEMKKKLSKKNELHNKIEKEFITKNLKFMYPSPLKKDIIYNFINNSLPEQKVILIESTNKLLLFTEEIEKLNNANLKEIDISVVRKSYDFYIDYLNEEIRKLKSNKSNFEKEKKKL